MMLGAVDARKLAIIELELLGADGAVIRVNAIIDTGYDGFLTISPDLLSRLGSPYDETRSYELGNGEIVRFAVHDVDVIWDSRVRTVSAIVTEGGELIGMSLLTGFELFVDVVDGGVVRITRRA